METRKRSSKCCNRTNSSTLTHVSFPEKVVSNVLRSPYFRSLYEYKTFNQVGKQDSALMMLLKTVQVDEIYNQVTYLEPWVAGKGVGTPSSAFCLLYKLFTLKLTVKQIRVLLRHKDSPYIRALGFLYLRFGADPRVLWSWFEPYLQDEEPIVLKYNSEATTIGKFVRGLLSKPKFFDVVLPRIPVTVQREIERVLNERFPEKCKDKKRKMEHSKLQQEPLEKNQVEDTCLSQPVLPEKKSRQSSLYLEDLKKRYGDTSGTLETRMRTQQDTDNTSKNSQLPTAVNNYLQTY